MLNFLYVAALFIPDHNFHDKNTKLRYYLKQFLHSRNYNFNFNKLSSR